MYGKISAKHVKKTKGKRFILTSAQNNTKVHKQFWENLNVYAQNIGASIKVSRFTYNKATNAKTAKVNSSKQSDYDGLWYDPCLVPHFSDEREQLAPGLIWCGDLNILPTASKPLSGLENYLGSDSIIVPHSKVAMESVAGSASPKFLYTTGTVTLRNYIQRKEGQKADFHHAYAALLVETDGKSWWCRQLIADQKGTICDKNITVEKGKIFESDVKTIVWGDIHVANIDPVCKKLFWSSGGVIDILKPARQVFHDILDFESQNHHNRNNPIYKSSLVKNKRTKVADELLNVAKFLHYSNRYKTCHSVIVESNHDRALARWINESDWRDDLENADTYLSLARKAVNNPKFPLLFLALAKYQDSDDDEFRTFLQGGDLVKDGDIVISYHGDIGPNGAKGSRQAFAKAGFKAILGHSHSAGITDGVWQVGTTSKLRMEYNKRGPSSWSHTFCVIYKNGKRALYTVKNGKAWL